MEANRGKIRNKKEKIRNWRLSKVKIKYSNYVIVMI